MTKLNDIDSKLTELLTNNKNEIDDFDVKIETADKAIQDANEELKDAESTVNVEDYNKAKNNIWSAKHAKELYQKAKTDTEKTPLIDRKQYNSILKEIKDTADSEQEELNKKAIELITNIRTLATESREITNKANELMNTVQRHIYREPEGNIPRSNGTTVWSSDKTYNAKITVDGLYVRHIKGTPLSNLAGEGSQQEQKLRWGVR